MLKTKGVNFWAIWNWTLKTVEEELQILIGKREKGPLS